MTRVGPNLSGLALFAVTSLAWGFNAVAIKVAADHFPPLFAGGLRCLIVFVCMLPWLKSVSREQWPILAAATFLNGAVHFALIYVGTGWSSASIMAVVDQLYVPFAALL